VLDTHAWVWIAEGREGLDEGAVALIDAAADEGMLRLSVLSMWEVGMLEARGRIRFDIPCLDWVEHALDVPGLSLVPLTPSIAVNSSRLPGDFHGDPADRVIVATTRAVGGVLVTRDERTIRYAAGGYLKTVRI
jgi:PIN domain nuclease of toxin-antitoxin system